MKHLLLVSHFFPPMGGGGVQRVTKFVKYLHVHGWRSSIAASGLPTTLLRPTMTAFEPASSMPAAWAADSAAATPTSPSSTTTTAASTAAPSTACAPLRSPAGG